MPLIHKTLSSYVLTPSEICFILTRDQAKVSRQVRPQRGGGRRGGGRISKFNGAGLRSDLGGAGSGGGQLGAARSGQVGEAGSGGGVNAAAAPDQLPDISGLLGSLPALPALPSLPDLSSIPVIGGLLGSGGAAPASPAPAAAAAPASGSAAPGSIVALTTEVGVIIGDRIGEPIGVVCRIATKRQKRRN